MPAGERGGRFGWVVRETEEPIERKVFFPLVDYSSQKPRTTSTGCLHARPTARHAGMSSSWAFDSVKFFRRREMSFSWAGFFLWGGGDEEGFLQSYKYLNEQFPSKPEHAKEVVICGTPGGQK